MALSPYWIYSTNAVLLALIVAAIVFLFPTTAFLGLVAVFVASLLEPVVQGAMRLKTPPWLQYKLFLPGLRLLDTAPFLALQWRIHTLPGDHPLSRGLVAVILVFGVLGLLVGALVVFLPALQEGIASKLNEMPAVFEQQLRPNLERLLQNTQAFIEGHTWFKFQGDLSLGTLLNSLPSVTDSSTAIAAMVVQGLFKQTLHAIELVLLLALTLFAVLEWPKISQAFMDSLYRATPRSWDPSIQRVLTDIHQLLRKMIIGMAAVGAILSLIIMAGLPLFAGYPLALAIPMGLICGYVSIIPYVGTTFATIIALFVTFLLNWFANPSAYVWTFIVVFGVNFFLEGKVLTPKLVGGNLKVFKIVVILAVAAAGEFLGFVGFLIALPALVVIKALVTEWWILMGEYQSKGEPTWLQEQQRLRLRQSAVQEEILALVHDGVRYRQQLTADKASGDSRIAP
ncbi:MAG: AI-2E family transporter [Candidatus Competibacterales bacterium]